MDRNLRPLVGDPSERDLLDLVKREIAFEFNCHAIGTIQSFNAAEQTARVTVNYKQVLTVADPVTKKYSLQQRSYPALDRVPVVVLQGGGGALTFPIAAGDECILLFNDRDLDNWFKSGATTSPPTTARTHALADAVALVGLYSLKRSLANYDTTRAVLRKGNAMVGVGNADKVKVSNGTDTLNGLLQDLLTELSDLCTQIEALTVTYASPGGPAISSVPNNAAAIAAISTRVSTTATKIGELLE